MPHLAENHYGKSRVRVMKVTREGETHTLHEWNVGVYLTGDFSACFLDGDNTGLIATDTMKNTVYAVARTSAATTPEDFALEVAGFLVARNPQVATVRVTIEEKVWIRIKAATPSGAVEKHGSAFMQRGPEVHTTAVTLAQTGGAATITSGVRGLVILKTSHSAFAGFQRDELTTLPETGDRLLGTEATIEWVYSEAPSDFRETRTGILETLLTTFANHDSLSVQQTLYAMAEAALAAEPLVAEMTLTMPNRHNIPVDFSRFAPPFDYASDNTIFVPQDEPNGLIHARVVR
jgi:urate oxidase